MPIYVTCQCGKRYGFKQTSIGKQIKCPACGAILKSPDPATAAEPEDEFDLMLAFEREAPSARLAPRANAPVPPVKAEAQASRNSTVVIAVAVLTAVCIAVVVVVALVFVLGGGSEVPDERVAGPPAKPPAEATPAEPSLMGLAIEVTEPAEAPAAEAVVSPATESRPEPPLAPPTAPAAPPLPPPAGSPAESAAAPAAPAALLAGPRFAEVREAPDSRRGTTVQWYGEAQSTEGSRVTFIGAKSTDGRLAYRFIADFAPQGPPAGGKGVVSGKVVGAESITEPLSGGAMAGYALMTVPLVIEAKFQPAAGFAGGTPALEVIQAGPAPAAVVPVVPVAPSASADPSLPAPAPVQPAVPVAVAPAVAPAAGPRPAAPPTAAPAVPLLPAPPAAPVAASPAEPVEPNPPEVKERNALRLLRKCSRVDATYSVIPGPCTPEEAATFDRAVEFVRAALVARGLAESLRPAVGEFAQYKSRARFVITAITEEGPSIDEIRKILGAETGVEVKEFLQRSGSGAGAVSSLSAAAGSAGEPVTWHRYGWLSFGEAAGRVVAVRADCRKLD